MNRSTHPQNLLYNSWNIVSNQHGSAILFVLVIAVLGGIVGVITMNNTRNDIIQTGTNRSKIAAFHLAEAGFERAVADIKTSLFTPVANKKLPVYTNSKLSNGLYSVQCSSNASVDTFWLYSEGKQNNNSRKVEVVYAQGGAAKFNCPPLFAALSANHNVQMNGNITIDGREYDSTGLNIIGSGVYGVSSTGSISTNGSPGIGGQGIAPPKKGYVPAVVDEFHDTSDYFDTPEALFGLSPGALDAYKIKASALPIPFHGIYYVTEDIQISNFYNSTGILIVHNDSSTASIKTNGGTFKGIVIADLTDKITGNTEIIGAVYLMSKTGAKISCTGTPEVKYCRQVLDNLESYCTNIVQTFAQVSWKELRHVP